MNYETARVTQRNQELRDKIDWTEKTIEETIKKTGSESSLKIRIEQAASELAELLGVTRQSIQRHLKKIKEDE